jgi:FkbM family methyltransferase
LKDLAVIIYKIFPISLRNKLGHSSFLKPLRDIILRSNGVYREVEVLVKREYFEYVVRFFFFASIKVASKAKNKGIENTILRNSIKLIEDIKTKEGDVVILDIEANFGYLSLVWANTISKNGKVIAFEPNLNVYRSFGKSIGRNNLRPKIQLNNLAVGNENGTIELFMESTTSNTIHSNSKSQKSTIVPIVSIDSFMENQKIEKCDLIKIDVDGIELNILMGAKKFLKKFNPIFIVETNGDTRIIDFFEKSNYEILDMELNVFQNGNQLPPNIFCIPKPK